MNSQLLTIFKKKKKKKSPDGERICKKKRSSFGEDRISKLPDKCLYHIFSLVDDIKTIGRSSAVSKRWLYLWISLPTLSFKNPPHYINSEEEEVEMASDSDIPYTNISEEEAESEIEKSDNGFMNLVDNVLWARRDKKKYCLENFHVDYHLNSACNISRVTKWICFACKRRVQDLRLSFQIFVDVTHEDRVIARTPPDRRHSLTTRQLQPVPLPLDLPRHLFTSKTIKVLQLSTPGTFFISVPPEASCFWPQLQVLHFEMVIIKNGDWIVQMLDNCPRLRTLILVGCHIMNLEELVISSPSLDKLVLRQVTSRIDIKIKICAPNLTWLTLHGSGVGLSNYSLLDVSSVVKADIRMGRSGRIYGDSIVSTMKHLLNRLCHVKDLALALEPDSLKAVRKQPFFVYLRCLKLITWTYRCCIPALTHFLKISPLLETLILERQDCAYKWIGVKSQFQFEGLLDHIKTVELKNFQACVDEFEFLQIILKNAKVLEKIVFANFTKLESEIKAKMEGYERASPSILVSFGCEGATCSSFIMQST